MLKLVLKRRYPRNLRQQGLPREEVERQFFVLVDSLAVLLTEQSWLAGDTASIADFSVAAQLDELIRTSDLAPRILERPSLKEWLERCSSVITEHSTKRGKTRRFTTLFVAGA